MDYEIGSRLDRIEYKLDVIIKHIQEKETKKTPVKEPTPPAAPTPAEELGLEIDL